MNKKEKLTLVPKLRFPEFRSTGEWKLCKLSDLASKITVRNKDNLINRVLTNSAVEGVVDQSDYFAREVSNKNNLENYFVIDEGDYVYNPRISVTAPVGPISKNKVGKGVMSPLYTVFRFDNPNNDFYTQYFKTNLWHSYLKRVSNTGARHDRMSISNDDFMKMPLPYNSEEEQQKIADCLSSFDGLINTENKKLDSLKIHKKGLMQMLFPAEGKTLPELRFPEFRDCGEWEVKPLKSFIKLYRGSSPRPIQNYLTKNNGVNWIKIGDAKNSCGFKIRSVGEQITHEGAQKSRFVTSGELILANSMSYGKTYEIEISGCIYDGWFVLREYEEHFNKKFLLQQLNSDNLQNQYSSLSAGGVVQNISSDIVYATILKRPQLEEQKKIAEFLSSIDDLITAQTEKIEALKSHKKGLMQGLFPFVKEVGK
ncbi:restriction endonuclease subunit S [Bacillus tropicus]|uniref:restriction endonuclease subunit S n=1 Tax=Bacillus tropicus TaxID=2026188 RepID=UPI002406E2FB|nr:restriction endonuclease subunit S [Bacillus tropicus]MDF9553707.1 restriction endonuclease subunit S [Bacillus tropicus]MDF9590546.1 restriction endonuclease subunit S [Bacillus tropicus]MDF9645143.1 restriction endonuclease subunit S [Bacillus tropicus]